MDGEEIRFIEMFAGIGGFRLGLEKASQTSCKHNPQGSRGESLRSNRDVASTAKFDGGATPPYRCLWANDNDKWACQVYRKNFGDNELVEGDINTVDLGGIPDHDLLAAGFPCQSFSVAGKRKGFQDPRGTLFWNILQVIDAKRPPLILLENVKGLLSHDRGETFATILRELGNRNYWTEYQILNSRNYSVPQKRERVFIVGHLGGRSSREIFPVEEIGEDAYEGDREALHCEATSALLASYRKNNCRGSYISSSHEVSNALDHTGYLYDVHHDPKQSMSGRTIRRLIPVECERLQGFPDGWTEGLSDNQRWKCLGNAVTVNVIEYLGRLLLHA